MKASEPDVCIPMPADREAISGIEEWRAATAKTPTSLPGRLLGYRALRRAQRLHGVAIQRSALVIQKHDRNRPTMASMQTSTAEFRVTTQLSYNKQCKLQGFRPRGKRYR